MSFATRAMNIGAPAQDVWPRLVQMGYHRAGWYTFALIDNQGHRIRSASCWSCKSWLKASLVPDAAGIHAC
jgi:hypothetical protein